MTSVRALERTPATGTCQRSVADRRRRPQKRSTRGFVRVSLTAAACSASLHASDRSQRPCWGSQAPSARCPLRRVRWDRTGGKGRCVRTASCLQNHP